MTLLLKCSHCGNKTILCDSLTIKEKQCACGECGLVSTIDEQERVIAYIEWLKKEIELLRLKLEIAEKEKAFYQFQNAGIVS